jgi:hypothetical protein
MVQQIMDGFGSAPAFPVYLKNPIENCGTAFASFEIHVIVRPDAVLYRQVVWIEQPFVVWLNTALPFGEHQLLETDYPWFAGCHLCP